LIDFEDTIRLEAISLQEALKLKKNTVKKIFVIGEGIRDFLPTLKTKGFSDLWTELEKDDDISVKKVFQKIKNQRNPRGGNALLMYAYVDYVLNHTEGDLMIFLNPKSGILANKKWAGPTYDEIVRTLQKFPKKFERIHFVTGLFDINPVDFEKQNSS
jgi:hypothetical protein